MSGRRASLAVAVACSAVAVLVVAAVTAPAPAAARSATGAPAGPRDRRAGAPNVSRTVTYDLTPNRSGTVTVTVDYRLGPDVTALVQGVPADATPLSAVGFHPRAGDPDLAWNGTTSRPSLTLRLSVNETADGRAVARDDGDWALFDAPYLVAVAAANGSLSYSYTGAFPTTYRATRSGAVGPALVYLGNYTAVEAPGVRVVVPAASSPRHSPRAVAASLARFGARLRVGDADPVTAVVAPAGVAWHDAGHAYGDAAFWVRGDAPRHTWLHEYVHTRQPFHLGPGMAWFREASASYYAALGRLRRGTLRWSSFYDGTELRLPLTLADPTTWRGTYADYVFGPRVLAALDARIRRASDGNATLQTVFASMNAHRGTVSIADFRAFVAAAATRPLDGWLDRYVASPTLPAVPRDPCLFLPPGFGDADRDGIPDGRECRGRRRTNPYVADTDGDGVVDGLDTAPRVPERPYAAAVRRSADADPSPLPSTARTDARDGDGAAAETGLLVALAGAVGEGAGAALRLRGG